MSCPRWLCESPEQLWSGAITAEPVTQALTRSIGGMRIIPVCSHCSRWKSARESAPCWLLFALLFPHLDPCVSPFVLEFTHSGVCCNRFWNLWFVTGTITSWFNMGWCWIDWGIRISIGWCSIVRLRSRFTPTSGSNIGWNRSLVNMTVAVIQRLVLRVSWNWWIIIGTSCRIVVDFRRGGFWVRTGVKVWHFAGCSYGWSSLVWPRVNMNLEIMKGNLQPFFSIFWNC